MDTSVGSTETLYARDHGDTGYKHIWLNVI
jgi:hypothetical protein